MTKEILATLRRNQGLSTSDFQAQLLAIQTQILEASDASDASGDAAELLAAIEAQEAQKANESLVLLRRMIRLLESQAVVDGQNRQRITLDALAAGLTLAAVSTVGTVSTVSTVGTVGTVSNQLTSAGMGQEQYINIARNTYANSIRANLTFT